MNYQKQLICSRCGEVGTIRKVTMHNVLAPNDEHVHFMCVSCKSHSSFFEALASNFEDFPYFLEEDWEWGDEKDLQEKVNEEDIIDLTKEGEELEKEKAKLQELFPRTKDEENNTQK